MEMQKERIAGVQSARCLKKDSGTRQQGKKYVTIAIGCTGGKHRSVAIAEEIARQLTTSSKDLEITAHATHRDVGRE